MAEYISKDALIQYLKPMTNTPGIVIKRYVEDMPTADVQPVDRWIDAQKNTPPIVDRRSMTSDSVLILIDNVRCAVAYYCYDDEDGNCWVTDDEKTIYDLEEVTRWQPLPEPPKDGDTE